MPLLCLPATFTTIRGEQQQTSGLRCHWADTFHKLRYYLMLLHMTELLLNVIQHHTLLKMTFVTVLLNIEFMTSP